MDAWLSAPATAHCASTLTVGIDDSDVSTSAACWSSRPASRRTSRSSCKSLPCMSASPRILRRDSFLATSPSRCGSCSSGAVPSTVLLYDPALRLCARGTAWIRCCRNSMEATAGDSHPQLSGGRGMLDRSTRAFVSGAATLVTYSQSLYRVGWMGSRSRWASSSILALMQLGLRCQNVFFSRMSGCARRVFLRSSSMAGSWAGSRGMRMYSTAMVSVSKMRASPWLCRSPLGGMRKLW
mmetsp:Transcript_12528/g.37599  ORF Transcript_12528/g.37599 Transcript_12528/m.37599 type:complete len:239 (+) Transcript_12528:2060-2776(+)